MMHVLMISLDPSLIQQPNGETRARHRAFAERAGQLTIIVHARADSAEPILDSPHLTLIPTNRRTQLTLPVAAVEIGRRVAAESPVDLIVTQDIFLSGLAGLRLRGRLQVPLLVQVHTYLFGNQVWLDEHPTRNRALLKLATHVLTHADFYRTVNERERRHYLTVLGGTPERVAVLPLGTASAAFAAPIADEVLQARRAVLGIRSNEKVMIWVGSALMPKRLPLLMEVFRRVLIDVPKARLLLVGDLQRSGEDLTAVAESLGLSGRMITTGPVAHADLPLYYALADVYAHTSSYEGMPRVLFEASAAGLPLVGMQVAGVEEVIEDGVSGYLVPDGDAQAMANAIASLFNEPERARALGLAARSRAFARYDAETYPDRWVGLWRRAVELGMRRDG